ncbi:unnamed protein product [Lathyrus sativus]|nr:unnamed protein product [Lathyrus sativus]
MFESDSQIVVQAIHSNHIGGYELYLIISSIKVLLSVNYNFEVKLISHQANMVAYYLAREANSWPKRISLNLAPSCIKHFLIIDIH